MIYFVRVGKSGPIKIGYSENNIESRIKDLQIGSPEALILMGVMEGDKAKEREMHEKFKDLHIRGEWFRPGVDLRQFIFQNTDFDFKYTAPDELMIEGGVDLDEIVKDLEIHYITKALDLTSNHKQRAAAMLGISFRTFRYRIQKYGIIY